MSVEPTDYVARLRAQASDPGREEALRRDRAVRRRKIALAAGAGVLLLGGFGYWLTDVTGERPPYEPYAARTVSEELWPLEWPYSVDMPFRNSPASGWAEGADGIHVPEAVPSGGLTAKDVTAALDGVKTLLVATNLSEDTLAGAEPTAALALLDPRGVDDAVRKDMVTRFDPEEVYLHRTTGIRTRGAMTYEVSAAGELVVHADYTFVYPLVRADLRHEIVPGLAEAARIAVRRQMAFTARGGKLVLGDYASEVANHDCSAPKDGVLHPLFAEGRWKAGRAAEGAQVAMADLYDEKRVLPPGPGHCVVPTGT
ncbi:hypothetical protein [Streptomyces nymphaeiformis]|uniref:Uncharacterized protein n=1 Tax=Streptomyces nymphaeiformis TaxID=2663842 RepID=A0A7W7U0P6_9ACTN|nr:hypothetical protein [Streptomyces nymphaeiformis]MBB4982853.1 hypothetical protein [Streptomyces nymphaeiformis]